MSYFLLKHPHGHHVVAGETELGRCILTIVRPESVLRGLSWFLLLSILNLLISLTLTDGRMG
jgi:hypothetical protein